MSSLAMRFAYCALVLAALDYSATFREEWPDRVATRAGPPIVGSCAPEAFGAVRRSKIAVGSSSDPDG